MMLKRNVFQIEFNIIATLVWLQCQIRVSYTAQFMSSYPQQLIILAVIM